MPTDKGSLQYTIAVQDKFSRATRLFQTEMAASRRAWRAFKQEVQSARAPTTEVSRALTQQAAAARASTSALRDQVREIARGNQVQRQRAQAIRENVRQAKIQENVERGALAFDRDRQRAIRQRIALERAETAAARRRRAGDVAADRQLIDLQTRGQARRQQFLREGIRLGAVTDRGTSAAAGQAKQQQLVAQALAQTNTAAQGAARSVNQLNRAGARSNSVFGNFLFTFRRLFGVFAAFAAARALIGLFNSLTRESIRFNAQLETATLGIATIIQASGAVRNAMGGAANSAEQFALAQQEARRQVQLLRRDGLATSATFEELLETFQVAIGPGLAAGLDVDEIRQLSVRISQAATAIGLPQNQLAEEIRSILSGTIQLRTTRLAAVLGITNEEVRNARELGQLSEFLQKRFEAFAIAGEAGFQTFNVVLSNAADAVEQVIAAGALDLFDELKGLLEDVLVSLTGVSSAISEIELSPRVIEVVRLLTAGLAEAVRQARQLVEDLSFEEVIDSARLFASLSVGVVQAISTAVEILVTGLSAAAAILEPLVVGLRSIAKVVDAIFGEGSFRTAIVFIGSIVTGFFALKLSVLAIGTALVKIGSAVKAIFIIIKKGSALNIVLALATVLLLIAQRLGLLDRLFNAFGGSSEAAAANVQSFGEFMEQLPAQLQAAGTELSKFQERVRELEKDLRGAQDQARFEIAAVGLEGAVRQQQELLTGAFDAAREENRELSREITQLRSDQLGTERELQRTLLQQNNTLGELRTSVEAGVSAVSETNRLKSLEAQLDTERAGLELEVARARAEGNEELAQSGTLRLAQIDQEVARVQELRRVALQFGEVLNAEVAASFGEEGVRNFQEAVQKVVSLRGKEAVLLERLADLDQRRLEIERLQRQIALERIAAIAAAETFSAQRRQEELALETEAAQRLAAARVGFFGLEGGPGSAFALAQSQNALELERLSSQLAREDLEVQRQRTLEILEQVRGTEQHAAVQLQLIALNGVIAETEEAANQRIAERTRELERQLAIQSDPTRFGFLAAFEQFTLQATDQFQNAVDLMTGILEGFTKTISDSIVDAFDPTQDTSLKERFGAFFRDIARIAIEQLVRIALVRTALNLGFGGIGFSTGGGVGFAEGGEVPQRAKGRPGPAHFGRKARGFARGGLDPRDTIPAWLSPGEYVQRRASVRKYGAPFMEALNRGLIDPFAAKALLPSRALAVRRSAGPGHALGGLALTGAEAGLGARVLQDEDGDRMARRGAGAPAIVTASPTVTRRLKAGGRAAEYRFALENRTALRQALGVRP